MKLMKTSLLAIALCAAAPMAMAATTGSASAPIAVTLTLNNACTITTDPVAFGTQTSLAGSAIDATGDVKVTCTSTGPYTVSFGAGNTGTIGTRLMGNGTDTITYNLYKETGHTNILGDGTTGVTLAGSTSGTTTFNVYGHVDAGQDPKSTGAYSDSVTATVAF